MYALCVLRINSLNFNEKMNGQFLMEVKNFWNQNLKVILIEILNYFIDFIIAKDQDACLNNIPNVTKRQNAALKRSVLFELLVH